MFCCWNSMHLHYAVQTLQTSGVGTICFCTILCRPCRIITSVQVGTMHYCISDFISAVCTSFCCWYSMFVHYVDFALLLLALYLCTKQNLQTSDQVGTMQYCISDFILQFALCSSSCWHSMFDNVALS